jgi:F0F1-type ATP synthase assembly protein I
MSQKPADWRDAIWGLALATQVGGAIAFPVLLGLAAGWWIDNRLHTLPWVTLLLTGVGTVLGPIVAYRWVTTAVRQRMEAQSKEAEKEQGEES